jgi:hypothetical protein
MLVIRISPRIGHIKIQGTQHVQKNIPACTLFVFFFLFSWRNLLYTTCMHWTNRLGEPRRSWLVNLNWPGDTNVIY